MGGRNSNRRRHGRGHVSCAATDSAECRGRARMVRFAGAPVVPLCSFHEHGLMRALALDLIQHGQIDEAVDGYAAYCASVGLDVVPLFEEVAP